MSEKAPTSYDRALAAGFLDLLTEDGPLHPLVRLVLDAPEDHALDLHLRRTHVTLYLGLTKAFDLCFRSGQVRLQIHRGRPKGLFGNAQATSFNPDWQRYQPPEELAVQWPEIRAFVHAVVTVAIENGRYHHEGRTHAALRRNSSLTLIDREWVLAFSDAKTKAETLAELHQPFTATIARLASDGHPWAAKKKAVTDARKPAFGDEIDAVLVDDAGRLVVMEVKLQDDTGGAGWTPAQVGFYAAIVRKWCEADPDRARGALQAVLDQRAAMGLAPTDAPRVRAPSDPAQVVLLVPGTRNNLATVTSRMRAVADALAASGYAAPGLLVQHPDGSTVDF